MTKDAKLKKDEGVQAADEVYKPKPLELSKRSSVPKTLGMPKSKKPWKVKSERSSKHTPYKPVSW